MFSVAVHTSVTMVSRYDVISSEWSSHFWVEMKVKLVDEVMQSAYLCIILHVKHKKLPFIAVSNRFLIIGNIQDGCHCWWHHRLPAAPPPNKIYLILLRRSKAFHWRLNRFEILQHIKNTGEGFHQPSLPLYHGGGVNLRVHPRVKRAANRGTYNQ